MDKCFKVAALFIATLKAVALIHQHNHWTTKGDNFFSQHKLFDEIYHSALEDVDLAAETFIGNFGVEFLSFDLQNELLNKVLLKYKNLEGSPGEMSLSVEKDFLKFAQEAFNCFEAEGKLSLELDDVISSIASNRGKSVYHLQQTLNS
jgi:DNA-binding ferritin-like protein